MNTPQAPKRTIKQETLSCGVELLSEQMPGYHTATLMVRVTGGLSSEPEDKLGLGYITEQSIDKGSAAFTAKQLADAFDSVGANYAVHTGLQSWVFVVSALPEFLCRGFDLLTEMICRPAFPDDVVQTAVALTQQEMTALEDSPQGLLRRELSKQAYGPVLGRHRLGTRETLQAMSPAALHDHWKAMLTRGALTVSVAGNFELGAVKESIECAFEAIPDGAAFSHDSSFTFRGTQGHVNKDLEQTQVGISFPGVSYADDDFYVEKVILEILSGGMGARLFTEVREKQGLVYWVSAWHEQPRGLGMIHVGAATTAERCQKTFETLLREVGRLEEDVTEEELQRAKVGILAGKVTSGASVHRRAGQLLGDYFQLGKVTSSEEHVARVQKVSIADIKRYLKTHPRDQLSIVTIGKEPLSPVPEASG